MSLELLEQNYQAGALCRRSRTDRATALGPSRTRTNISAVFAREEWGCNGADSMAISFGYLSFVLGLYIFS